jgi:4'-phosphopantetheinyl transferase
LTLGPNEVHVWRIALGRADGGEASLAATLSPDEQTRAARLPAAHARRRFVAARGALRTILGRYAGLAPAELRFCYGLRGKPALDLATPLRFNLSHSSELALLAVAHGREIGVDVEAIRADRELERIADRFFSAAEVAALRAAPPEERADAFYRCWTRKEAYIKAVGDGLAIPLDSFDVACDRESPARLLANRLVPTEVDRWLMAGSNLGPGYAAAVVVEGGDWSGGMTCLTLF